MPTTAEKRKTFRQLHQAGNEVAWWENLKINALEIANSLWDETHGRSPGAEAPNSQAADSISSLPAKP